jgi:hypothetical protein
VQKNGVLDAAAHLVPHTRGSVSRYKGTGSGSYHTFWSPHHQSPHHLRTSPFAALSSPTKNPLKLLTNLKENVVMEFSFTCRLVFLVVASVAVTAAVVVESLAQLPAGWKQLRAAEPEKLIRLSIALHHTEPELVERSFYEIADPDHERYGKHLEREELAALVKPPSEATAAVLRWLQQGGVEVREVRNAGQWIHFVAPVGIVESLLSAKLRVFTRHDDGRKVVRALSYSIPEDVRHHIATIQPITYFGGIQTTRIIPPLKGAEIQAATLEDSSNARGPTAVDLDACKTKITPACLRTLYNIHSHVIPHPKSLFGVPGFLGVGDASLLPGLFGRLTPYHSKSASITSLQISWSSSPPTQPVATLRSLWSTAGMIPKERWLAPKLMPTFSMLSPCPTRSRSASTRLEAMVPSFQMLSKHSNRASSNRFRI